MDPLKVCSLCGCNSNETAIFSCSYAKGNLDICLECLTEGIMEISRENKGMKQPARDADASTVGQPLNIEGFDLNVPDEVFGFKCEGCENIMFSDTFPVVCECGHINTESVLHKQDLLNKNK